MTSELSRLAERAAQTPGDRMGEAPPGWAHIDLATPPDLGLGRLNPEQAERINAWLPAVGGAPEAARPFTLSAAPAERERALLCLTQAVYYEAALEPTPGQEAVAQTVLNRVRSPAFPKSICGVVYKGASQVTGCQFTFTCDGSRSRPPVAKLWRRARAVAERAVSGYVMTWVGEATHYHADYVFPAWGPSLVKIRQFGAQIFYRFPGPAGRSGGFLAPYLGGELRVSLTGPSPEAILAARRAGVADAEPHSLQAVTPPPEEGRRIPGQVYFGRRVPTREEIDRINGVLAAMAAAAHPSTP